MTSTVTQTAAKAAALQIVAKEERVLVFAPYGREASLTCEVLAQAGLSALVCHDAAALREALNEGAGAALLTEEALSSETLTVLEAALKAQPSWSELPLLVCLNLNEVSAERQSATETLQSWWDVTVLETPLRHATLISVVRSALRARRRQYQVRDLLAELETLNSELDERIQARTAELHRSELRFSRVFYASPLPISITTLTDGRFIDINESALTLLGLERNEVVGHTAQEFNQWEHAQPEARAELLNRLETEGSLHDVPIAFHTKTGELRDGLAAYEVIELEGEPCLLTMFLDITERKRSETELMQAVQEVMSDTAWFSRSLIEKLAQVRVKGDNTAHQAELKELTPREKQVLERVAQGQDNKQIAADLNLAENTVRNYLTNVFDKLNLHSRANAVVWARERGLGNA